MRVNTLIVDDFYVNPNEVREFALSQDFKVEGNYPGQRTISFLDNDLKNSIQKSSVKNLDIIGSNVNLSGLEVETASDPKRAFLLKEILEKNQNIFSQYENIFIDCPLCRGFNHNNSKLSDDSSENLKFFCYFCQFKKNIFNYNNWEYFFLSRPQWV